MRNALAVIALCGFLIIAPSLPASVPAGIHASYDVSRQTLFVTVQHVVTDRLANYISEVVIYKNGSEVARKTFDFQSSRRDQTMPPFRIPAVAGDAFKIVATCDEASVAEKTLTVPGLQQEE